MRDTRREIRLTAHEADAIDEAARVSGSRVADWMRRACIDRARGEGAVAAVNDQLAAELVELRGRVARLEVGLRGVDRE